MKCLITWRWSLLTLETLAGSLTTSPKTFRLDSIEVSRFSLVPVMDLQQTSGQLLAWPSRLQQEIICLNLIMVLVTAEMKITLLTSWNYLDEFPGTSRCQARRARTCSGRMEPWKTSQNWSRGRCFVFFRQSMDGPRNRWKSSQIFSFQCSRLKQRKEQQQPSAWKVLFLWNSVNRISVKVIKKYRNMRINTCLPELMLVSKLILII